MGEGNANGLAVFGVSYARALAPRVIQAALRLTV